MSKPKYIYVICGGFSGEREVSLRSGKNVYEALRRKGYTETVLFDLAKPEDLIKLVDAKSAGKFDLAVLMTHGDFGEDGCIQGFLEILGVPYTGSNVETSAICMNKIRTKEILSKYGLPVLTTCRADELLRGNEQIKGEFIIKPINGGSSVGVVKFNDHQAFVEYERARTDFDATKYFAEPFVRGTELTTSIIELKDKNLLKDTSHCQLQEREQDWLVSLPLLELRPKNEFYDYEAKYTKGMTDFVLPAQISSELEKAIHGYALRAFEIMNCRNAARVDFIIDKQGQPYIFEVNTLPGMTDTSDLPAQAASAGIDYDELVAGIIYDPLSLV